MNPVSAPSVRAPLPGQRVTGRIPRSRSSPLVRALLICGISSSLLYVAMNVLGAISYEGYNSMSQTVSELSAVDAPTRPLWQWLGLVYTLLSIAFGGGVWMAAGQNRSLRWVGVLFFVMGALGVVWPYAPMHQREVLAAGGKTFSDTLHIIFAMVDVVLMMSAIGFGAAAFGKRFRLYSIATIMVLLAAGALTSVDAPRIEANLPTPLIGLWERINIGVFLLWVVVLAIALMRSPWERSGKSDGEKL